MRTIVLDASKWRTVIDFYRALLPTIGAPEWHGTNINALVDSMIVGGINTLEPPYTVKVVGTSALPKAVLDEVELARAAFAEGRREFRERKGQDVEVNFEIYP
jgi:RNAse (barnase) inhibitor barstar